MKILVKIIFLLLLLFVVNIIFYYISSDYRLFLENLKYDKTNQIEENINNSKTFQNEFDVISEVDFNSSNNNLLEEEKYDNIASVKLSKNPEIISTTVLGKNYTNILNKFEKKFDLDKIEVNTKLFEITDEYPDYYYEYYSRDLTLYFFTTKRYSDLYDMFEYLQIDLPFSINEVNNFGEKSFYINLDEKINDNYIRLVISENGITFGLKINKSQYENVKNILNK